MSDQTGKSYFRFHALILRAIIAANLVFFALSFWPRYAGTEQSPGLADEWFGNYRLVGFRADFVWLVLSPLLICLAFFGFVGELKGDRPARADAIMCGAWLIAFAVIVYHELLTGVLYFG